MNLARVAISAWALTLVARAGKFPDYQPLSANQYPSYQEQRGIGVAAVPMLDTPSEMRYLGTDLLASGFLPVYVVFENHANPQSAILLRNDVLYSYVDSGGLSPNQEQARPGPTPGMLATISVARVLATPLPTVPAVMMAMSALRGLSKISEIRLNLLEKELRSLTVAPGKAGGGFVFLPASESGKRVKQVFLEIPVKAGASNEKVRFHFRIELGAEAK
jgi:hypothetical protein